MVNGERRSTSTGQKALAHALIYPEAAKVGRGQKVYGKGAGSGTFHQRVSEARTVVKSSPTVSSSSLARHRVQRV
jgi:hypothetical protein